MKFEDDLVTIEQINQNEQEKSKTYQVTRKQKLKCNKYLVKYLSKDGEEIYNEYTAINENALIQYLLSRITITGYRTFKDKPCMFALSFIDNITIYKKD